MRDNGQDKIGSGHVRAMGKLGLAELRGALYPNSNVAQPTEYGVFGKETPGEVAQSREGLDANQEPLSVLAERMKAAEAARDGAAREPGNVKQAEREAQREDR